MAYKKWIVGHPDREFAKNASEEFDIDPFSALLAYGRGIDDLNELEYFLSNDVILSDINDIPDIKTAADTINEAIEQGVKIAVFGDYDCDGVVAVSVLYKYLVSRGADPIVYIPDRLSEGYGMNTNSIDELKSMGVELIITVDNGISCIDEIDYASSLGIVTIVTDHHLPGSNLPDAAAVVDLHRNDCFVDFKNVCGAVVAFKLICAIDKKVPEELIYDYADLLSIATIGDVMPIVNENRSIVKCGIKRIKSNSNVGISAILSVAGIDRNALDSSKISFGIVPRINAAGRMGSAERAFKLLTSNNMIEAIALANEIENENQNRQKTEKDIAIRVIKTIEDNKYYNDRVIIVSGEGFHQGVIGIVAARICEKYGKPAFVISSDGNVSHGSGRSIAGFNLFTALNSCADFLTKFGGHELAAGVSLFTDKIDDFRIAINNYAITLDPAIPTLNIDFRINPLAMSTDMVYAIKALEPFGQGNPLPVFGIFDLKISKITPIGQGKHLRLSFLKEETSFQALLFGVTLEKFPFNIGDNVDIAVTLDTNSYKGEETLSIIIKAIKISGVDDDKYFEELFACEDFLSDRLKEYKLKAPTREEIGKIYKFISTSPVLTDRVKNVFINEYGYATSILSIIILKELNLIKDIGGLLSTTDFKKTDLANSDTYNKLIL